MAKRETLLLAHTFNPRKHSIEGWMMSQKIDGIRCFWDGGVTLGIPTSEVPWANTAKDGRYKEERIATGLWSRYLKPIYAPVWWLDRLPKGVCLDGELYSTRGWQHTSRIVKRLDGGGAWEDVRYYVFDAPKIWEVFPDGEINIPQLKKEIVGVKEWWVNEGLGEWRVEGERSREYEFTYNWMVRELETNESLKILKQEKLPLRSGECEGRVNEKLMEILGRGGEGLMVRSPYSSYVPERSHSLLKIKGMNDDEGMVVGYIGGKGKLVGLFGALVLDYKGRRLELSGFTDEERKMIHCGYETLVPEICGGLELSESWEGKYFKRGDVVTFKYRELSDTGIPKEGRYWRKGS